MKEPLSQKIRPQSIQDVFGQKHILGKNGLLTKITKSGAIPNMIFYGPPGTGKTTVAEIISKQTNRKFYKINATTASLADIKNIVSSINPILSPNGILLYLDEIQYFNKKQQQSLLEFLESGDIVLIASTTENPYFYIYNAILSRSQVFEFKPVEKKEIIKALNRAIKLLEKENNLKIETEDKVVSTIAELAQGDIRKSINMLEICFVSSATTKGKKTIKYNETVKVLKENAFGNYNKTGDEHFDLLSAFQKSLRGSDADAAIYYLARLLEVGELLSVCRRLLICTCEDVGLAYPQIIPIVKSLTDIAVQVGMPEARIPLADAVIMVASSPKSNSAYQAINIASQDIQNGSTYKIPRHLKNVHCDSENDRPAKNNTYKYPHDFENHWVKQQYLPDELRNKKYYKPQKNKNESAFKKYIDNITGNGK